MRQREREKRRGGKETSRTTHIRGEVGKNRVTAVLLMHVLSLNNKPDRAIIDPNKTTYNMLYYILHAARGGVTVA